MAGEHRSEPLVGRATELAQLDRVFRDTRDEPGRRGRLVLLSGESGIGKTALGVAFAARVARMESRAITIGTACLEGEGTVRPYGPFRDLLAQLRGLPESAGVADTLKEAPAWLPNGPATRGRNGLFDQFINLCRAIARARPFVFTIDDLQWSDRSSLDLLTRLVSSMASVPMLILGTYEPSGDGGADSVRDLFRRAGPNAIELALHELEPDEVAKLGENLVGGSLGGEVGDWITSVAGGNALRAEQYVRLLAETGILRKGLFRFSLRGKDLPDGSEETEKIIGERLDSLEPRVRWTLEAAALVGTVVDSIVVANQVGRTRDEVLAELRRAEGRHGLIMAVGERRWATGSWSVRFRFRHPLIRRALRERVTEKRRGYLLTRAAEKLEQLAGEGAGEIIDEIAGLRMEAAEGDAHEWVLKAAHLAERFHAIHELEAFLQTATGGARDEQERLRIESRLARIYSSTGREAEAEALFESVYERARSLGDPATEVSAGVHLGWLRLERGYSPVDLVQHAGRLVDTARAGERKDLVMALELSCVVGERLGRAEEALLMAEEALYVAEQSGDAETVARAAYRLAAVHLSWGNPEEGNELAKRALEVYEQVGDIGGLSDCHELLGLANFRAGDWSLALHHWEAAMKSAEAASAPEGKVAMQANIADLLTLRGEFDRALSLFESGLKLAGELEDAQLARRCRTGIARLEFERGNYPAVLELTDQIREILPDVGAWRDDFQTTAIRALAYLELGDELQAWHEAARLEQLYQGKEGWFERRAEGDAVRMRVIDLDSDAWLAGMVAQQGIGETVDKDPYGEGFLQYHQALVLSRTRPAEARQAAERAVELFGRLGAEPMLKRARRLIDRLPEVPPASTESPGGGIDEDKIDQWFEGLER
jgi:tetratricopeptide (TPR) repeat protein